MTANAWQWKGKDGSRSGLLYEPGNWGDLLKMLWLARILLWKGRAGRRVDYFDPFAGEVSYPLAGKALFRFNRAGLAGLEFIRRDFLEQGCWPSAAAAARLLIQGRMEVFDADPGRRRGWAECPGAEVLSGACAWTLTERRAPDSAAVWLLDPYNFLGEWRTRLPLVVDKAKSATILLYVYNRSAGSPEAFEDYRAFRNALEDARPDLPVRLGRVAADGFLPRAHHEMFFLPGRADVEDDGLDHLLRELEDSACETAAALQRAAAFDA